jgi:hypothetical protein
MKQFGLWIQAKLSWLWDKLRRFLIVIMQIPVSLGKLLLELIKKLSGG